MIVRGGDRVGIYFNEKGASQRGSVCISNEYCFSKKYELRIIDRVGGGDGSGRIQR